MDDHIIISSFNCQGLGGKEKRKDVLNYLKQKHFSIYCLQDTHFTEKEEKYIRAQWGYECYFNSFNSQSRGTAILLNNNFEHKVNKIKADREGNKIILDINFLGKNVTLINIYGPNRDCPAFYEQIRQDIRDFNNDEVILTGDFNMVIDPEKDSFNYVNINNPRAREKLLDISAEFNLVDIWREYNMETIRYTWRTNNRNKQARLDYFLISENFFIDIIETNIELGYRSDHSIITIKLKGSEVKRGKLFWKFNNSLLKDPEYVNTIKKVINETKSQYIDPSQSVHEINIIPNSDLKLTVNDQLFFETLLLEIRGKTISYSSFKKKQTDNIEQKIITEINDLEDNPDNHELIKSKQIQLQEVRKKKMEGLIIRSRAKWVDQGEKATRYFCNLENRNFISKSMPNLFKKDGSKTESQAEILKETKTFYESLYARKPVTDININNILDYPDIPKLTENQKESLEGNITHEEALKCLKNMKNNKSPGSDGFTAEFFKFFWVDIGIFLVRAINCSYMLGELSSTQKEGVITCLPKGNKDKQYLKNWRPISLLNVTYKISSACIANRIKTVLPHIIHEDQTGFISGRFIGENIRKIYDLLYYTEKHNIPGLLLLIDFEKAFDSVAWSFIFKVLAFFNFGPSLITWIKTFYKNIKSCVTVNGQISQWFTILRGCRQGDPLSPYIFIICAEILAILIRKDKNIKGIMIDLKEHLVSQYADDTSLTLDATERSLNATLKVLKFYADASGLRVNMDKTKVVWFGSMKNSKQKLCLDENLSWEEGVFTLLGVKFTINLENMIKINYEEKIRDIKSLLIQWSKRILTPYGRITVVKSLAMAKINHLLLSLPNPPEKNIRELDSLFFKFIWNGSTDKIKRVNIIKPYEEGGLKMIKVNYFIEALKISWIRRITQKTTKLTYLLESSFPNILNFTKYGLHYIREKLRTIDNKFWYDTFQAWISFSNNVRPETWNELLTEPIWYNIHLKVGGKPIFYKNYAEKGVLYISDLIDENGNFYDINYIKEAYQINTNFIEFHGIIRAFNIMKNGFSIEKENCNIDRPNISHTLKILLSVKKGCQHVYKFLIANDNIPTAQRKWTNDLLLPETFPWQKIYNLHNKITKDTNLKWFQYRLIHRILATNTFLCKIGIKEDNRCSFCKNHPETIRHIFGDCHLIQNFWHSLEQWLRSECVHITELNLSLADIIFGINNNIRADSILNFIILFAKQYIYCNKYNNTIPYIQGFKTRLLLQYNCEKYLAYSNCEWTKFNNRWMPYKILIESIQI